jgi:hypothetical protein
MTSFTVRNIYPAGFLKELRRTLNLLWPIEDKGTMQYVRKIELKESVDIEASMGHEKEYDLRTYPVFGERLSKIQERLEAVQNRRGTSLGIKVAIWGIVFTAAFGMISAITGIMQVWASFQALNGPSSGSS